MCYHSRNASLIIPWGWQWKKPTAWKFYPFCFLSTLLFLLATFVIFFQKQYQKKISQLCAQEQYQQLQSTETHQTNLTIPNTSV